MANEWPFLPLSAMSVSSILVTASLTKPLPCPRHDVLGAWAHFDFTGPTKLAWENSLRDLPKDPGLADDRARIPTPEFNHPFNHPLLEQIWPGFKDAHQARGETGKVPHTSFYLLEIIDADLNAWLAWYQSTLWEPQILQN